MKSPARDGDRPVGAAARRGAGTVSFWCMPSTLLPAAHISLPGRSQTRRAGMTPVRDHGTRGARGFPAEIT
ncbi:hypothetical protein GCM10025734_67940 [Kitasatospora paranensis]